VLGKCADYVFCDCHCCVNVMDGDVDEVVLDMTLHVFADGHVPFFGV
jgi:hypothetical protein